jgi:hypothetical protein
MAEPEKPAEGGAAPAPDSPPAAGKGIPPVFLKGELEIYPDQRLGHLDQGTLKAFAAKAKDGTASFALICERGLVPQPQLAVKYYSINTPFLPKLVGFGTVFWPLENQERFVFVYENKLGKPIAQAEYGAGLGLKVDYVINTAIRNLVSLLKSLRDSGFVHGNIRLQNLYDGQGSGLEKCMVGEVLASPPGYFQPVLYETIERGVASPLGRGQGSFEDDMYSFGVLLAVLVRQHDPMEGLSDEEIVLHKIDHGSFASLISKDRLPATILELLRGLLNDDAPQRWTIDDVLVWMDGRRVNPKQGLVVTNKASRPIDFLSQKFLRPSSLAISLPQGPSAAVPLIEGGDLFLWLNRSLQDKETEVRFEEAVELAKQQGTSGVYADRLAAQVALALKPTLPLMYRGLKFRPEALGRMLVNAVLTKKDLSPYVEQLQGSMIAFWAKYALLHGIDCGDIVTRIEMCRNFLRQNVVGYGLERCVYYLSSDAPCLSEKFLQYHVRTPEDLLMAFEKISHAPNRPSGFFDRHIIAFLSVRDKAIIDPYVPDLNAEEKFRQAAGTLRVLAGIQKRAKLSAVPGVSAWVSEQLGGLADRFHDREERKKVKDQLQKLRDKGDLSKIESLFDNYQILQADMRNFVQAMKQYQDLKKEFFHLEDALEHDQKFGFDTGRQMASLVSGVIAGIIIFLFLIIKYSSSGGGSF